MGRTTRKTIGLILLTLAVSGVSAQTGRPAPEWAISEWINGDPGSVVDNRGRVILIDFFQLWCPGCNRFSIPLFERWDAKYGARDDILIVSIHTVFEGHASQSPDRLRGFVADQGITHPVGIDAYADGNDDTPITMSRYRTRGTPHVVIVDKHGRIRFSRFGRFDPGTAERLVDELLAEDGPAGETVSPKSDLRLSGNYRIRFEQTTRSCGEVLQPFEVEVRVEVFRDRVTVESPGSFLGVDALEAEFDPDRGEFVADLEIRTQDGPVGVSASLELQGWFHDDGESPQVDFRVWLDKVADDPDRDCRVEATGTGVKIAKR